MIIIIIIIIILLLYYYYIIEKTVHDRRTITIEYNIHIHTVRDALSASTHINHLQRLQVEKTP